MFRIICICVTSCLNYICLFISYRSKYSSVFSLNSCRCNIHICSIYYTCCRNTLFTRDNLNCRLSLKFLSTNFTCNFTNSYIIRNFRFFIFIRCPCKLSRITMLANFLLHFICCSILICYFAHSDFAFSCIYISNTF